ncbi:MAG: toxin TumE, partial [Microcystaceae cyanobacterium]
KILEDYLKEIELALLALEPVYVERYTEEILTPNRVNLRLRIRWPTGYLLEINEAIIVENNVLIFLDYRYHCQDQQNSLIFRYDSTPHFPGLSSFPHHKHLLGDVIACEKPELIQVLQEVTIFISP